MMTKRDIIVLIILASVLGYLYLPFWESMDLEATIRYSVVLFAATSFYFLNKMLATRWRQMWRSLRRLSIWVYLLLFATVWRAIEASNQDAPIGPANIGILAVMVGFTISLMIRFENDLSTERIYQFPHKKEK